MITRRTFLRRLVGTIGISFSPLALPGCGARLQVVRGRYDGAALTLNRTEVEQALQTHGAFMIRAAGLPVPILLRRVPPSRLLALSTICTHAGCQVRPRPDGFHCPCHGSQYDRHGAVVEGPASQSLQQFPVVAKEHHITIRVAR